MRSLLAISLLTAACAVAAAESPYSNRYAACIDESAGVTATMIECIGAEVKTQDGRLNIAYRKLAAVLTSERKQQLVAAQRLWIQYRDANCAFYADPDGGSMARINANDCVLRETAERAVELESLLE